MLTMIYIFGAAAVGLLIGMIVELMLDAKTIRELQDDNRKLRLEKRGLELQIRDLKKTEVIEITDKTVDVENVPNYSQDW